MYQGRNGNGVEVVLAVLEMIVRSGGFALTNRSMEVKEP